MMSAFNENLISDCLRDSCEVDDQGRSDAGKPVACDGFELRLNNLLDDRVGLSSDRGLQAHADECLKCRQVLQQYQQLDLLLAGEQCLRDDQVELAAVSCSRFGVKQTLGWAKFPLTVATLVAMVVLAGQYFNDAGNVGSVASVAVADADLNSLPSSDLLASPNAAVVEDFVWVRQESVSQLKGLVDSGAELLTASQKRVAVIRGISDVRLDLVGLESRLESLQPMLNYSGRIPAFSPMHGTVCFTLGWLKKDKAGDLQVDS